MNRLAFDTSTAACTVALRRADGELYVHAPPAGRMFEQPAHTTELLPAIIDLLDLAGVGFDELGALAVGVGPGAFTGLRIGVATARGIATARGLPLTPVSSLAALEVAAAGPQLEQALEQVTVLPVIDARRGEFFFRRAGTDAVATPEELLATVAALQAPVAIGDGAIKLAEQLEEVGAVVPPADDPRHVVSAAAILDLAESAAPVPIDSVLPNYIRPPDAKVSARESWLVGSTGG